MIHKDNVYNHFFLWLPNLDWNLNNISMNFVNRLFIVKKEVLPLKSNIIYSIHRTKTIQNYCHIIIIFSETIIKEWYEKYSKFRDHSISWNICALNHTTEVIFEMFEKRRHSVLKIDRFPERSTQLKQSRHVSVPKSGSLALHWQNVSVV